MAFILDHAFPTFEIDASRYKIKLVREINGDCKIIEHVFNNHKLDICFLPQDEVSENDLKEAFEGLYYYLRATPLTENQELLFIWLRKDEALKLKHLMTLNSVFSKT